MSKRAIILAGGLGTRLRPYTVVLPKPLMPVGEYSILEVIIRQLVKYKFEHITLAVNHQAEIVKALFQNGERWGIKIDYSLEKKRLGTMGPLKLMNDLPDDFLIMNGDVLTDLNFESFFYDHVKNKCNFTISSKSRNEKIDYGVLEIDNSNCLRDFKEKPSVDFEVSMGIYMMNKNILSFIPDDDYYGFDNLMLDLLKAKREVKVINHSGYWLDIGRPDEYIQATEEFEEKRSIFLND